MSEPFERPLPWAMEPWDECGGYGCITPAITIVDAEGRSVVVVDARDYGWFAVGQGYSIAEHREKVRRRVYDLADRIVRSVNSTEV